MPQKPIVGIVALIALQEHLGIKEYVGFQDLISEKPLEEHQKTSFGLSNPALSNPGTELGEAHKRCRRTLTLQFVLQQGRLPLKLEVPHNSHDP